MQTLEASQFKTAYLEFAEQVVYKPIKQMGISFGGYVAVKLGEELKNQHVDWISTSELDLFNSTDYGLTFGLRRYIKSFTLFVIYDHGLVNVSNLIVTNANGDLLGALELKNQTVQVGLGYIWNTTKEN